jgi:heme exporter protein A
MSEKRPANQLEVSGLCGMRGDRELFSGLNFSLRNGQLLHLKGHNGSGKTTLMRILAGLLHSEDGEIRWNGEQINKARQEYHEELLYLGHLNGLKGDLSAVENLRIDAAITGQSLSEEQAWQVLNDIGLRGHEDLPTKYLSQGQKRRVALARLWFSRKKLWILDEPFSALDVAAVDDLQAVIRRHLGAGGMVIVTTHQEVALTSGEVYTLELGKNRNA